MGPLTRILLRIFVSGTPRETRRTDYAMLEGWVSVVINTLLFVVKLILGLMSGSIALIADAVHTISDSLTSVVVIVSAYTARRPADEEHPFGHGRAESIATVLVAVLLGVAGIEFGKSSVERLIHPETIEAPWWVVAVIAATMLTKEWLARFALDLARSSGNKTLEADAWHHRSDVLATALVVVAMVAGRYGLTLVDGIMGILISVVLFKVAYEIAKGAIDTLLGPAPTKEQIRAIAESAESVQGVRGVHDIVIHSYGPTHFYSLHIEVDANLPATELHALAEQVEHRVNNGEHGSVCVHIDPIDIDHPFYASTHALVEELVKNDEHVRTFHDLRIFGSAESYTVACDVTIDPSCHEADGAIRQRLERAILDRCDAKRVIIEIDPRYSYPGVTEA